MSTSRAGSRPSRLLPLLLGVASILVFSGCPGDSTGVPTPMFTLHIIKDAQPDDPQDFEISINGFMPAFVVDDDPNSPTPNRHGPLFREAAPLTIMELPVPGWNLPVVTCVSVTTGPLAGPAGSTFAYMPGGVTVTPVQGAIVQCTFINSKVKPSAITIIKDAQPDDAQDFVFTSNLAGSTSFTLDDDPTSTTPFRQVINGVANGSWTFTETQVPGWTLSSINCVGTATSSTNLGAGSATINITPGTEAVCTFTNVAQPSSITIIKDAQPNDSTDFAFTSTIPGNTAFSLDDDSNGTLPSQRVISNVPAGTYTLTEGQLFGWALSALTCTGAGATTNLATRTATLAIVPGSNIVCTFTNSKQTANVTIIKDAQPNDSTNFVFTTSILALASFPLDDDSDGTISDRRTFTLQAGTYSFTEGVTPGWSLTGLTCTPSSGTTTNLATRTATIVLVGGVDVTCTFTNTRSPASITIVKESDPNDSTDFTFTYNHNTSSPTLSPFVLDDDGDVTNARSDRILLSNLEPGTFTFNEQSTAGWTLIGIACNGGSTTTSITGSPQLTVNLAAGDVVLCRFVNERVAGSVTVIKDAQPNDSTDFTFTSTLPGGSTFPLDDDGNATLSDRRVFGNVAPGSYTITESQMAGWGVTAIDCTGGAATTDLATRTATITVVAGSNIACTFSNARHTGTLTVIKDAQPNNIQDFRFVTAGGLLAPFLLDDDTDGVNPNTRTFTVNAGVDYTVTEDSIAGWRLNSVTCVSTGPAGSTTTTNVPGRSFTANVAHNAAVTCTVVNVRLPGTITIVKDAAPNDTTDFTFTYNHNTSSPTFSPFFLDDDGDVTNARSDRVVLTNLVPGTFIFNEQGPAAGWTLSAVNCTGGNTSVAVSAHPQLTVNLAAGDSVVCTYVNTRTTGSVAVIKDAQPNDSTDFTFTSTLPGAASFLLDDDSNGTLSDRRLFPSVAPGTYTVTESQLAGWGVSGITCTGGGATADVSTRMVTITVVAGASIECTFMNVPTGGSITIVKDATPDSEQDFDFTVSGMLSSCCLPFKLDDDALLSTGNGTLANSKTFNNLVPGTYTFQETPVAGWDLSGIVCSGGSVTTDVAHTLVDINLASGASVTCTFSNTRQTGTLTVVKDAQPNDNLDFRFVTAGGLLAPFLLDDDTDGFNPSSRTFTVNAGVNYTVTEDSTGGWRTDSIVCVSTGPAGSTTTTNVPGRSFTANVAPNANVTCTVVNVRLPGTITIIKDASPDDPQDFTFTYNHNTSSPTFSPFFLDDDGDVTNALSDRIVLTDLIPGTFIFNEQASPAGWVLSAINCTGGSTSANLPGRQLTVNLSAGDNVVCTYVNTRSTATLTVVKDAQPDDAQVFRFAATGGSLPSSFFLDNDPSSPSPASQTFTILSGVNYSITEDAVPGWSTPSIQCTLAVPGASVLTTNTATRNFTVNATPGANVTCTVINVKDP